MKLIIFGIVIFFVNLFVVILPLMLLSNFMFKNDRNPNTNLVLVVFLSAIFVLVSFVFLPLYSILEKFILK